MILPVLAMILHVSVIKPGKAVVIVRPQQGKGFVVIVKGCVQGCQHIVETKLSVCLGKFEFLLLVQQLCHQPEVCGEELPAGVFERRPHFGHIQIHGQGVARRCHSGKVIENLSPTPGVQINGGELQFRFHEVASICRKIGKARGYTGSW